MIELSFYKALDGTVFHNKLDYNEYKKTSKDDSLLENIYVHYYFELPISFTSIHFDYLWFKLKNKEDFEKLRSYLFYRHKHDSAPLNRDVYKLLEPISYPDLLCIQCNPTYKNFTGRYIYLNDEEKSFNTYINTKKRLLEEMNE